ncbi:hypothetical protein JN27_17820 [Massilia sp. BSC265]|nr:hypothetical protein JN27_17820 [Massilia sp. BSC265]
MHLLRYQAPRDMSMTQSCLYPVMRVSTRVKSIELLLIYFRRSLVWFLTSAQGLELTLRGLHKRGIKF